MINSVFQPPKGFTQNFQAQISEVNNFVLFQIIIMKVLVVLMGIFLPLLLKGDTACFLLTIGISLEFWVNKNMARSFLKAYWFVDTSTQKDRWVFEAQVKKPDTFQGLFWFSSLVYIILLAVCFLYYCSKSQLSLSCSLLIGLISAYLNFFAYGKIIKTRSEGIFEKISNDVNENGLINGTTVQLPLITVKSELKQIQENEQYMEMS